MADETQSEKQKTFESLVKQVDVEYQLAYQHLIPRLQKGLSRLALYNNQKRDPNAVGDSLLFSVHQTILASLYSDRLDVTFAGRDEGDSDVGENLTSLAKFDYERMQKDVLDYYWDWDTTFWGRGLVYMREFDRDKKMMCPVPELFDPLVFLRDPLATSVNGDPLRHRGAMRFGGLEVWLDRTELKEENGFFDTKDLNGGTETKSLVKQAKQARDDAQGRDSSLTDKLMGDNETVPALRWFTRWQGNKVEVYLANDRKKVIKYKVLKDYWPIVDRPMYPTAHDWDGVSIPDIVEDKQRQRAVVLNLSIQALKADLYPMYLYDEGRIKNKGDLLNFEFNKFVGVNGQGDIRGAVQPMNKPNLRMDLVNYILDTLDGAAQRATATPDMQQGQVANQSRTLGELNLVAQKVETRYSLSAKVFGWSEKEFWRQYYELYKDNFEDKIDEKIIRLVGVWGNKWRPLTRENIVGLTDPDISIESRQVAESEMARSRVLLTALGNNIAADSEANKKWFFRKLAKLDGLTVEEVQYLYPPTIDELHAEDENKELNDNKLQSVHPDDNDIAHIEIHSKAAETPAKEAHILAHKANMMIKKRQPELFQADPNAVNTNPVSNAPTINPPTQPAAKPVSSFTPPTG